MSTPDARQLQTVTAHESTALWGIRVLLAAAIGRALRAGVGRLALKRLFLELIEQEGDDDA
jgi:hypothetical protein